MKTLKLIIIAAIVIATLVIAVYGLTVLFSHTVPSTGIKAPGSGSATSNCSTLTMPFSSITAPTTFTTYDFNATCNGSWVFIVTVAGVFIPTFTIPIQSYASYTGIYLTNSTVGSGTPSCSFPEYSLQSGQSIVLGQGHYIYCIHATLSAYQTGYPSSLPSFTITLNAP